MLLCQKGEPSLMGEKVKTTLEAKLYDHPETITNTSDYFLALWMGSDEFTTAKICGEKVYKLLAELKEIIHPKTGQTLSVLRRATTDGKARRRSTGNSTACSSYPIPEAPQHIDQLRDMKVLLEKPLWKQTKSGKRPMHMTLLN